MDAAEFADWLAGMERLSGGQGALAFVELEIVVGRASSAEASGRRKRRPGMASGEGVPGPSGKRSVKALANT